MQRKDMLNMPLRFLGRGAAFNTKEGSNAAFLLSGKSLFLIDCGESVFAKLQALHLLDGLESIHIAVTHLHTDHVGSLSSLMHYCRYILHIRPQLIVPEHTEYAGQLDMLLTVTGCDRAFYDVVTDTDYLGGAAVHSVRYVRTEHSPNMISFSLVLESDEGSIFYSGDTCTAAPAKAFICGHPDFAAVYMDATELDYPGNVHLSLTKLAEAFPEALRARVHLMHFNADSCIEKGRALGFGIVETEN